MPQFHIRIASDDLSFSAGHFITLEGGTCERLHGHTYRVAAEVFGPLDDNQYVFDFVALHGALKAIVSEMDHRMLLPAEHPVIRVTSQPAQVDVSFGSRHWSFPAEDCLLLPIANTTTELLAQHIGRRLLERLPSLHSADCLRVEVSEGAGAAAVCQLYSVRGSK